MFQLANRIISMKVEAGILTENVTGDVMVSLYFDIPTVNGADGRKYNITRDHLLCGALEFAPEDETG